MFSAKIVPFPSSILYEIQTSQTYNLYLLKLVSLSIGFISYRMYVSFSAIDIAIYLNLCLCGKSALFLNIDPL